ncbi:MAG TPA: hypothetical protein DDZ80_21565 [Cyanobacteria bacterium UBA8803]|nr:hypothetical protein [Cyanobacteria bacterium UBA9273]HBL60923.1 hypothetical protein [Cyanobacteria bacterium UBA8803]
MNDAIQEKQQRLQQAQETIYKFLIGLVERSSPETVLLEFKQLFLSGESTLSFDVNKAVYEILFNKDEEEFRNTLKRSCYILINNWSSSRNYKFIQQLIQIVGECKDKTHTLSPSLRRLRTWLTNFIESDDYEELKLFSLPYTAKERGDWSHRYAFYLLVPQYLDSRNPIEQRELASNLARRLKEKFKFELAMYTVHCNSPIFKQEPPTNPTQLGIGIIRLLKKLISKNFLFNYSNYAKTFLQQTKNLNYRDFKQSLRKYLIFSDSPQNSQDILNKKLTENLNDLYESHHEEPIASDLLLRTCRRVIEFLTTEDGKNPSSLFLVLTTQGTPLTIVITLLKIILLSNYARTHLEVCIAKLIHYYENFSEKECQGFINFLDIFNVVFAIYTENVQYNLVKIEENESEAQTAAELDAYRVFSQLKGADLRGTDFSGADIRSSDLSAADLRGTNLSRADLSQSDLSLAKLSNANLSSALLNSAELIATDLSRADLNSANLNGANLNRADLRQANLSRTNLTAAKLRCTKLQQADLSRSNLSRASLNSADLSGANLQQACLPQADLSDANLSGANLSNTNLSGADLRRTQLLYTNLKGANLSGANLSSANLMGTHLAEANLNRAELNQSNLGETDLHGALLRRALLSNARLSKANLSNADLSHADLSHVNLSGANLSNALLRHVNLSGADLSFANLNGANLFNTNLKGANVKGTLFGNNAGFSEAKQQELEHKGAIFESTCFALDDSTL